jgi:hypothetical protein
MRAWACINAVGRVLQLGFGFNDDFTSSALSSFNSDFGDLQFFGGAPAQRLSASFGLPGVILHVAENFGGLVHNYDAIHEFNA